MKLVFIWEHESDKVHKEYVYLIVWILENDTQQNLNWKAPPVFGCMLFYAADDSDTSEIIEPQSPLWICDALIKIAKALQGRAPVFIKGGNRKCCQKFHK